MMRGLLKYTEIMLFVLTLSATGLVLLDNATAKELKLAHFMPSVHTLHQEVFTPLAEDLAESTGGDLTIRIFPSGALGKGPVQQYKRAVEGVADITFCIHSYTAGIFPRSLLATRPGVALTAEQGTCKVWDIYDPLLKEEYQAVKVLGIWVMSPTCLITKTRAVRTLADMKGMKVRISSPGESQLIQAWKAVPVAMPITESYNALNTGVVDAVLIQPSALYRPWNLAEPGQYVTDNLPSPTSIVLLAMNKQSWNGLSPRQQADLENLTGRDFSLKASVIWSKKDVQALEKAQKDSGIGYINLTSSQRANFAEAARPTIEQELGRLEKKGINARAVYDALTK